MRYQLVLQFPSCGLKDYDNMIELENDLVKILSNFADVDGHDMGSGEMNIYILTNSPEDTFAKCLEILKKRGLLQVLRAAFRDASGNQYNNLWPKYCNNPFIIK